MVNEVKARKGEMWKSKVINSKEIMSLDITDYHFSINGGYSQRLLLHSDICVSSPESPMNSNKLNATQIGELTLFQF